VRRAAGALAGVAVGALLCGAGRTDFTYSTGSFAPEYTLPEPGSYSLPVIRRVADHPLLDATGRETSLFALKGRRAAVVAFVYMSCAEATGCPYSMAVLHRLDSDLAADPNLSARVVLLTVSFDPDRDTPERLTELRELHHPKSDWRFATTSGQSQLQPLLADFDQSVAKLHFPDGRWSGLFRHVLKVFLLDEENRVRNVYSVGFLDSGLVLTDLRTLLVAGKG
jgi:cytochrome c peroxidase